MALNFRKFLDGIRIIPKTTSTSSETGDIEALTSDGKVRLYNAGQATANSPIVTEAHSATLTNKTLDSAVLIGPTTLDVNSASDALRITQTGAGAALRVEDSTNPDSTPFIVDASGNVAIGTTSILYRLHVNEPDTAAAATNILGLTTTSGGVLTVNVSDKSVSNPTWTFASGGSEPIAFSQGGVERLRIDSTGNVGIGISTLRATVGSFTPRLQVEGIDASSSSISIIRNSASAPSAYLFLGKTRSATTGGVTTVQTNDNLGRIDFAGTDGIDFITSGSILSEAEGTISTGIVPGRLSFYTANSAGTNTERLRINSSGNVGIGTGSTTPGQLLDVSSASDGAAIRISSRQNDAAHSTTNPFGILEFYSTDGSGPGASVRARIGAQFLDAAGAGTALTFSTSPSAGLTEAMRLDSLGNVLIGTSANRTNLNGATPRAIIEGTSLNTSSLGIVRNSANAGSSFLILAKSRNAAVGGNTVLISGDDTGVIDFQGNDGTNFIPSARIYSEIDDTPATNSMPGALVLMTTPSGSASSTERMRISSNGNIGIATAGAGSTTLDLNGTFAIRSSANAQTGAVTITAPTTAFVRLTAAITAVRGVAGGVNGERVTLLNKSGSTISINHEDSSATAADRITIGGGVSFNLLNNASVELAYDSTASRWAVVGSASASTQVTSVSADTILTALNDVVLVNASGAARTITLPTPTSGKTITVKKTDSSANAVTISRSSTETIDGNNSVSLAAQYDSYTMVSDGTNWFII